MGIFSYKSWKKDTFFNWECDPILAIIQKNPSIHTFFGIISQNGFLRFRFGWHGDVISYNTRQFCRQFCGKLVLYCDWCTIFCINLKYKQNYIYHTSVGDFII